MEVNKIGLCCLLAVGGLFHLAQAQAQNFSLPTLPYAYGAMEPYIDATTMDIHWNRYSLEACLDKASVAILLLRMALGRLITHALCLVGKGSHGVPLLWGPVQDAAKCPRSMQAPIRIEAASEAFPFHVVQAHSNIRQQPECSPSQVPQPRRCGSEPAGAARGSAGRHRQQLPA